MFNGQLITGASASTTVTVKEQVVETFVPSVANTETVVLPNGKELPGAWLQTRPGAASQLSVGAVEKETGAAQVPAMAFTTCAPGQLMVGLSASLTVTVNVHGELVLMPSVARTVTVVLPVGKWVPGAWDQTKVGVPPQLSIAVTA